MDPVWEYSKKLDMRTGLKTFYRLVIYSIKHPIDIFVDNQSKFPQKKSSQLNLKMKLYSVINDIAAEKTSDKFGSLYCKPHKSAITIWSKLLRFNPNNMGNWSILDQKNLNITQNIERNLIKIMVDLYKGKSDRWEGYVTSGATEGIIFSLWLGRNFLKAKKINKINIISNSLTHYSVTKASDLLGIDIYSVKLNRSTWTYDYSNLEKSIIYLCKNGIKGFLILLTLGYTQTGTNDDFKYIISRLKKLESQLNICIFYILDAALNGLVLPFTTDKFLPLKNFIVQTVCVDFHKSGMLPYPGGIILYQKELRKYVEKEIPYIKENDNTLLGSRSGIAPVAAYFVIQSLGYLGFKLINKMRQNQKNMFKKKLTSLYPQVEIIDDPRGVSMGIVTEKPLPDEVVDKYGLFAKKQNIYFSTGYEKLFIYKCSFLGNNYPELKNNKL